MIRNLITPIRKYSTFSSKHIGNLDYNKIFKTCGVTNINDLINQVIPYNLKTNLPNISPINESEEITHLKKKIDNNSNKTYYGQGYHPNLLPNVINRSILENPKWYSPYTSYHPEISQGRLESLHNFQLLISELTKLPVSNAYLLDESTSAIEAMNLSYNYCNNNNNSYCCCVDVHPQIFNVLKTRSDVLGINLVVDNIKNILNYDDLFGVLIQYPNTYGDTDIPINTIKDLNNKDVLVSVNSDLMSLVKLIPPGDFGADICFGTTEQFGIPMWFGGRNASYFSTKKELLRLIPGSTINESLDIDGDFAYMMALSNRDQAIRTEKDDNSNVCTNQDLLANLASMYAVYHGYDGLQTIANNIYKNTENVAILLSFKGFDIINDNFFNTITIKYDSVAELCNDLDKDDIIIRYIDDKHFSISINETTTESDCIHLVNKINKFKSPKDRMITPNTYKSILTIYPWIQNPHFRKDQFLSQNIFNKYQTETDFSRYVFRLSDKDYSLTSSMKLNAVAELLPLSWSNIKDTHPYLVLENECYSKMITEMSEMLCDITGFTNVLFQNKYDALGEYSGLLCIREYHHQNGNPNRKICLIPTSVHETNFYNAKLADMDIVKFDDNITFEDFKELVDKFHDDLSCMIITYPNTFIENISKMCDYIHTLGGLVYMDGYNMNAQVGLINPTKCGADVCHINLYKTFRIPYDNFGVDEGPILTNDILKPFLPKSVQLEIPETSIRQISSYDLSITYLYIKIMGSDGLKLATEHAILNANYLKDRLKDYYSILFTNKNNRVGHEFILDITKYKEFGITEMDISKRLIDYNFHASTMCWPVQSALMIEPTESESIEELDRFCDAMISIYYELEDIKNGHLDDSIFKKSPHTIKQLINWDKPYTKEKACFPVETLYSNKLWPSIGRVDDLEVDKLLLKPIKLT